MKDEPGLPQPGDVVGGKYRVQEAIGAGGMGTVYRATHEVTHKAVALKWLHPKLASEPSAMKRFIREAQASARIRHPNVVDIYDIEEQDGRAFLVLELLQGETLRSVLRRQTLGIGECLGLLLPAMRGVAAAHAQGVIHRDIKPDNLFIAHQPNEPQRRVTKVLDFGISKVAADTPLAEGTLTATGAMLGTPHYMSLEQLQGAEVDARSDIYAFGVVLYECLTGRRPFEGESFSAIVVKVATETPVDPIALRSDLPPTLRDVVLKAMARHGEDRYRTLRELIDALSPFALAEGAILEAPPAPARRALALERQGGEATRTSGGNRDEPDVRGAVSPLRRWLSAGVLLALAGAATWFFLPTTADAPQSAAATAAFAEENRPAAEPVSRARRSGTDVEPEPADPSGPPSAFGLGWVYLGEYDDGTWVTRYFEGWASGLPAEGTTIAARGRSNVRAAMPGADGVLAHVRTIIGAEHPVEVVEVSRWQETSWVWARVRPDW